MEYYVTIAACRKKGVNSRRLDVVINDSYCDMWVFTNDQYKSAFFVSEGMKIELELYHLNDGEELSEKITFMAGEHFQSDVGSSINVELLSSDEGYEHYYPEYDEYDDDEIEHSWPKIVNNVFDDPEEGDLVLV